MNDFKIEGFSSISDEEMLKNDGGVVLTGAMIGAMVIWGINLGLASWGVSHVIKN